MTPPLALHSSVVERDGTPTRLLVLLHGYGEPVADLTYVESEGGHEMTDEVARQVGGWITVAPDAVSGHSLLDGTVARASYFDGLWDLV